MAHEARGAFALIFLAGWSVDCQAEEADNKFIEAAVAATAMIIMYYLRDFAKPDLVKHGWDAMTPIEFTTLYNLT